MIEDGLYFCTKTYLDGTSFDYIVECGNYYFVCAKKRFIIFPAYELLLFIDNKPIKRISIIESFTKRLIENNLVHLI